MSGRGGWRVGIDVGGTFTDVVAMAPDGRVAAAKSVTDTDNPLAALAACLAAVGLEAGDVRELVHGTTRITNAIVEGRLAPVTLLTTEGFADVLAIARQNRRELYDLALPPRPEPLVPAERRLEVRERLGPDGTVWTPLDDDEIDRAVAAVGATRPGAVAVALLHSYAMGDHEERLGAALVAHHDHVALSHRTSPEAREYERTATTVLSAAVMPSAADYLGRLSAGLDDGIALHLVQSDGGMAAPEAMVAQPLALALSGPAAGVTAAAALAGELGLDHALAFDMGGTTTDVSLVRDGAPAIAAERRLAGLPLRRPMVDVESVGAGGGSIARVVAGGLMVGPDSAGARPGPAAYGQGGTAATVTDANLVLGYLADGATLGTGGVTLDLAAARRAVGAVAESLGTPLEEAALGIHRIANAAMARAVQAVTVARGVDARDAVLLAYGGAGPMHAVALAREVGIARVVVPRHSSMFSASGCLAARPAYQRQRTLRMASDAWDGDRAAAAVAELAAALAAPLTAAGHGPDELTTEITALVRYAGQSYAVEVPTTATPGPEVLGRNFRARHAALYGFATEEAWELEALRVTVAAGAASPLPAAPVGGGDTAAVTSEALFPGAGRVALARHRRDALVPGVRLDGPAVVEDAWSTVVLPPGARLEVGAAGDLLIEVDP